MPVVDVGGNTMLGKANAVPYEDQAGMSEVQRRRLLMQQLLKESLSGGSGVVPDSGAIKVPDYAGAIGKVLQAYIGTKGSEAGAKEAEALAQKAQDTHTREATKFFDTAYGAPFGGYKYGGQEMAGPPKDSGEYTGMSKANMVEAIRNAATGVDPTMRAFGLKQQEEREKQRLESIKSGHFLPESAGAESDASQYQLKPNINVVGPNVVQTTPGKPGFAVPPVAAQTFDRVEPATARTPPLQYEKLSGEAKGFAGGAQTPENIWNQADIDARVKMLVGGKEKALAAVEVFQTNAIARDIASKMDPTSFGPASGWATVYNNVLGEAGFPAIPENTSRQELASVLAKNVRAHAKALSPTSNVDVERLTKDLGSTLGSKESIFVITNAIDQQMLPSFISHEKNVQSAEENKAFAPDVRRAYGINPADYKLDLPELRDMRRWQAPTPALTGTAALEAMPAAGRAAVEADREANPNIPSTVTYAPPVKKPDPKTATDQEILEYLRQQKARNASPR